MNCLKGCSRSLAILKRPLIWLILMGIIFSPGLSGNRCAVTWNSLLSRSSAFGRQPIQTMEKIRIRAFLDGSCTSTLIGKSLQRSLGVTALVTSTHGVAIIRSLISFLTWVKKMVTSPLEIWVVLLLSQGKAE